MYKYGKADIRSLQEILGHESIATTEIYTHIDEHQLQSAVNSNPLAMMFNWQQNATSKGGILFVLQIMRSWRIIIEIPRMLICGNISLFAAIA